MAKKKDSGYRFRRIGRAKHMIIESAGDLRLAAELDPALWAALSCPARGIRIHRCLLHALDRDKDGRISFVDLTAAIHWTLRVFSDYSGLEQGSPMLSTEHIDGRNEDGARILKSLKKIIVRSGAGSPAEVSLDLLSNAKQETESRPVSEAGVILPEAAEDPVMQSFIRTAVAVTGGTPHPSGVQGLDEGSLVLFLDRTRAYVAWRSEAEDEALRMKTGATGSPGQESTAPGNFRFPPSLDNVRLYHRFHPLFLKLDQYFTLCDAAAVDPRVSLFSGLDESQLPAMISSDSASIQTLLRDLPLARVNPDGLFPDRAVVNPYYLHSLEDLSREFLNIYGISASQWREIRRSMSSFENWLGRKPPGSDILSEIGKPEQFLEESLRTTCESLIRNSRETAFDLENLRLAEQAAVFQAFLLEFCNNFITFTRLYDRKSRAVFEQGRLLLDGRIFSLAVRVDNRPQHVVRARSSNMFVMYLSVYGAEGKPVYEIAVPVTAGGRGNITVGKRGVFIDTDGRDRDAEVVEVIENPIGLAEAVISPFKRLVKVVTGKIDAITAKAQQDFEQAASLQIDSLTTGDVSGGGTRHSVPSPAPGSGRGISSAGSLLLGGGVALAALGSALVYITDTIAGLRWWQVLIGLSSALLAVVLPAIIQAFIKLRGRDLSPIIEACGWAINARMHLTRSLCKFFTTRPQKPGRSNTHLKPAGS